MLRVESCCCGCSLKTGTLILLGVDLAFNILFLLSAGNFFSITLCAVFAVFRILGIYGVRNEIPKYLLPHMALQLINVAIYGLAVLIALLGGTAFLSEMSKHAHGKDVDLGDSFGVIVFVVLFLLLGGALHFYFFVVVYSYYTKTNEEINSKFQGTRNI